MKNTSNYESLAEGRDIGQFIQIYINNDPFFKVNKSGEFSHKEILERSLEEAGILDPGSIESFFSDREIITPTGKEYRMVGAGTISSRGSELILSGKSLDYEKYPNQEHLNDLEPYIPEGVVLRIK